MAETTYEACSTRALIYGLGYILLSKREYEKTSKHISEYIRMRIEEAEGKFGEKEWRTFEYEIARVNNELVKAQKRVAELEGALQRIASAGGLFAEPASGQHAREIARAALGGKDE